MRRLTAHDVRVLGELPRVLARVRYLWWRCLRGYESELCHSCGRAYFAAIGDTWWHAEDDLWSLVEGGPWGLRCPSCFTRDCRTRGIRVYWSPHVDAKGIA